MKNKDLTSSCPEGNSDALEIFVLTFGKCALCVGKELKDLREENMALRIAFAEAFDAMRVRVLDMFGRINRFVQAEVGDATQELTEKGLTLAAKGLKKNKKINVDSAYRVRYPEGGLPEE